MACKEFRLAEDLNIKIYKRKTSRSLKLSVTSQGKVQVSIPTWAPYKAGLQFAASREQWIRRQLPSTTGMLQHGQAVGKAHRLHFTATSSVSSPIGRLHKTEIIVQYPPALTPTDPAVQAAAAKACIRALRVQAEQLLPQRLEALAGKHKFTYHSVRIKQLKSRWGSCDQDQRIVLNLYLMQLPWECIDYVLLHELTHTRVLQHGPAFWSALAAVLPDARSLRRAMHQHQPVLKTLSGEQLAVA